MLANRRLPLLILALLGWAWGFIPVATAQPAGEPLERHFERLTVGPLAFTNVWVHRQTNLNILIRHVGGIHTIKLTDLPLAELAELRSQIGDLAAVDPPAEPSASAGWRERLKAAWQQVSPRTLAIIGAAVVLLIGLIVIVRRRGPSPPVT